MAYALFSRTYDIGLRNSVVTIADRFTGEPAIILESPTGGIKSLQGVAQLDNQAQLNVYIDTARSWEINVMDGQTLEYNVLDPKKIVSITELQQIAPEHGITYVLDKPPFTEYRWDGENLISDLSAKERALVQSMADTNISNVTYNGDGKITGYRKSGVQHTISYPDANTIVFSNETGFIKTVTTNGSGAVTAII
jgi:hypothetical protein